MRKNVYPLCVVILIFCSSGALSGQVATQVFKVYNKEFRHIPRKNASVAHLRESCPEAQYRTIDGTCNNTSDPSKTEWGAADVPLHRKMPTDYNKDDPYNGMAGKSRPSARAISNQVHAEKETLYSRHKLSTLVYTWGQFLDHDIVLTPEAKTEYAPIVLPEDEPLFSRDIPFFRSGVYPGTGVDKPREQINLITSWIDASNVYGSEISRASWLRTFQKGKLKTSEGNLLPFNTLDGNYDSAIDPQAPSMAGDGGGRIKTFVAGDIRAAEQAGLTTLHTLFVREHNRQCEELWEEGLRDDEEIYQMARKIVGALVQSITYNEFLPALGIKLKRYKGYDANVLPNISNLFATAAYRLGHTMVTNTLWLRDNNCQSYQSGSVSLIEAFFNPSVVQTYGIDPLLNGLAMQAQNEVDVYIIENLRNFLFGDPAAGEVFGLDLASLNIQRGRDHGLPAYPTIREHYTNKKTKNFKQVTSDKTLRKALQTAFSSVKDIDAWVGLLAEDHEANRSMGRTLDRILSDQFERLRDGDYYYFEHDPLLNKESRKQLHNTTLAAIIERNTENDNLPADVFRVNICDEEEEEDLQAEQEPSQEANIRGNVVKSPGALRVAPNPTSGIIQLQLESDAIETVHLRLFSLEGQLQYEHLQHGLFGFYQKELDLKDLPRGFYLLQLSTNQGQFVQKLLLQ